MRAREDEDRGMALALQRDLLKTQLQDLDQFVTRARLAGKAPDGALVDYESGGQGSPMLAQPGLESLLGAQLREVESWLEEVRRQDTAPEAPRHPHEDERLMLALHHTRSRAAASRRRGLAGAENAVTAHRMEAARDALLRARDAATQRTLAMEQAQGVRWHNNEDLARLCAQLRNLENDPKGRHELSRYVATDVALALVGAIEQRRALFRTLSDAVRAQEAMHAAVEVHEHLLACAHAEAVDPAVLPAHPSLASAPPASRLVWADSAGRHPAVEVDPFALRAESMAERNVELWDALTAQLSGRTLATSSRAARPRGGPGGGGGAHLLVAGSAGAAPPSASALRSELQTLRANEGRLDQLLGGTGAERAHQAVLQYEEEQQRALARAGHEAARGGGGGRGGALAVRGGAPVARTGFLSGYTLAEVLEAWQVAAHEARAWQRTRRSQAVRRYLGARACASALITFLGGLTVHVERPIPPGTCLSRGEMVRDIATLRVGTVCSMAPSGMCKVAFAQAEEVRLLSAGMLTWMPTRPHPALAGICLLAWRFVLVRGTEQALTAFREKLLISRGGARGSRTISFLATATDDPVLCCRIVFEAWRQLRKASETRKLEFVAEAWACWREGVLCSRHSKAIQELEVANGELHSARMAVLRQTHRFERLEKKFGEVEDMHNQLWCSWVLQAWQWVSHVSKVRKGLEAAARDERSKVTLALTEKLAKRGNQHLVATTLRAWSSSVIRRRQTLKVFITRKMAAQEILLSMCFSSWKTCQLVKVQARHGAAEKQAEALRGELATRGEEMDRLQALSQELYGFVHDATGRARQLEGALQAAERAIAMGATHSEALQQQVFFLEELLQHEQSLPGEAQARLAAEVEQANRVRTELYAQQFQQDTLREELAIARQEAAEALNEAEDLRYAQQQVARARSRTERASRT